jgi:hypothetical protein
MPCSCGFSLAIVSNRHLRICQRTTRTFRLSVTAHACGLGCYSSGFAALELDDDEAEEQEEEEEEEVCTDAFIRCSLRQCEA